jgi:hypothetical protein
LAESEDVVIRKAGEIEEYLNRVTKRTKEHIEKIAESGAGG